LDQLERRYCKDTPFFRPFYIGAPKGPFLPGLSITTWNIQIYEKQNIAIVPGKKYSRAKKFVIKIFSLGI
jgi:hypothetical protein